MYEIMVKECHLLNFCKVLGDGSLIEMILSSGMLLLFSSQCLLVDFIFQYGISDRMLPPRTGNRSTNKWLKHVIYQ